MKKCYHCHKMADSLISISWGTNQVIWLHDTSPCWDNFFKGSAIGKLISASPTLVIGGENLIA